MRKNRVVPVEEFFEKHFFRNGIAVGESRIVRDTVYFRFRKEEFEFPSSALVGELLDRYDENYRSGWHPQMKVARLRALKRKQEKTHG